MMMMCCCSIGGCRSTSTSAALLLWLSLLLLMGTIDSAPDRGGQVLQLDESNFDAFVLDSPGVVAVAFAAPWCGHCHTLKPEWEMAAKLLHRQLGEGDGSSTDQVAALAWVDATTNKNLAQRYQVQGYPTIKIFAGGAAKTRTSPKEFPAVLERNAETIVRVLLEEVDRSGVPREVTKEMISGQTLTNRCAGTNNICVIAALPHLMDSGAETRNRYKATINEVAKSFRGATYAFLWFEGSVQPAFETRLDLTFGFPAVVALSMDRDAYAVLHGAFSAKSITGFIHGITTGRQPTQTVPAETDLPQLVKTVEPWDGQDAPAIEEEEFSLEDIMGDDDDDAVADEKNEL